MLASIISAFLPQRRNQPQSRTLPVPGYAPILDREAAVQGNPLAFIGDNLTRMGGGDPGAGILDLIRPRSGAGGGFFPADAPVIAEPTDALHPNQSVRDKYAAEVVTPVGGTQTMPNQRRAVSPETVNANASEKPNDTPVIPANETVARSAVADGFYPGMDAGAVTDPLEARRKDAYARRDELEKNGPKKDEKFWKRALRGALSGLGAGRGLGGAIGGAGTGALLGGFFPQVDQAIRKPGELADANQEIANLEGQRNADQKYRRGETEIKNVIEDNKRLREQGDARVEAKKKEGSFKALNRLVQQKYYDPKNPAHSRLAELAGVEPATLEGWDDRNPVTKQVAGITYSLNRSTGAYEPTNLPADEAKVLTDYEITMPNGEKRKYRVSQKDAANFSTQMSTLGARFEENARQRDWQSGENEKNRTQALSIAQERVGIAKENLRLAQQRYQLADESAKTAAGQDVEKAKQAMIRLQAYLKNSPLILPDDPIWQDFNELNQP